MVEDLKEIITLLDDPEQWKDCMMALRIKLPTAIKLLESRERLMDAILTHKTKLSGSAMYADKLLHSVYYEEKAV